MHVLLESLQMLYKNIKEEKNIKLCLTYYYDSQKFDKSLIDLDNCKTYIKSYYLPYILLYFK